MAEATHVRIDGNVYPLIAGDDMRPGDLARIEAYFKVGADELRAMKGISVVAVAWVSANRADRRVTLDDVCDAHTIEMIDEHGNIAKDDDDGTPTAPAPADDELLGSGEDELEEKGSGESGAP